MGTPQPKYPLSGHCSIIYEETLYVYSPSGFQSLKLEEGAEWKSLPMDISLTGAECVKAVPKGNAKDAKLFIVGGQVNETASTWNYPGLMHYTFSKKKWDWQRSESWNTQNRVNHAATYLQDSQQILVYAGSQSNDYTGPSTESFLFSTVEPYAVSSIPTEGAPPSVKPMLMNSDANTALLVGGGASNTAVWKYSESDGWQDLGVSLEKPIANQDSVKCSVISNKDGRVALQKFDMSVTPNSVERILLLNKDGSPAKPGTFVGDKVKRVAVDDWSSYNETFAPTTTRSGYSLAQGDDGTTVASGGDDKEPIALFNAQENSWMNASALFDGQQILVNSVSSSASSTATPTASAASSASPTSTGAAASPPEPPSNKGRMLTVLGATLGTIFGIAVILILILFCLKYRKNKSKKNTGYMEKNDRMSFADRGAAFMKEAGGSVVTYQPKHNNDSLTSLAIIQGRGGSHKKNVGSDASTAGLVKKTSPLGYSEGYSEPYELAKFDLKPEPVEPMVRQNSSRTPKPAPRARSSGWSRYFANNEATNLASAPPADRSTFASDRTSTASQSQYTNSRMFSSRPSQHIAPLEIPKFNDGQRLSSVASGSPTLGTPTSGLPVQIQPMQAELARANSTASTVSALSHNGDHYLRQPVESWTPVGDDRRSSSQYTGSMVIDHGKFDGTSSYYPEGTDSFYPKSNYSSFYPGQGASPVIPDLRDSTFTMFPTGNAPPAPTEDMPKSKFSSMYPAPPQLGLSHDRESTATVFPGGPGGSGGLQAGHHDAALPSPKFNSFYPPPRIGHESTVTMFPGPGPDPNGGKKEQSDMSWLNLGQSR
ncbi:pre-mrna splicing factor clf1 protein [Stemphylium lycopersici]|uniref:Pre-mrna splicing factor clf1 protein n=1 Tax=Stemphylium lycopersici TaxID=183478 RepID=A0A364MYI4_STELY|nr:pre-mrna splicing factor clf1 protein [Stemphylium lycopersici]RAR06605.1 pre-mrna splicing factor clf1 protein [Stemphylium lycopersici]